MPEQHVFRLGLSIWSIYSPERACGRSRRRHSETSLQSQPPEIRPSNLYLLSFNEQTVLEKNAAKIVFVAYLLCHGTCRSTDLLCRDQVQIFVSRKILCALDSLHYFSILLIKFSQWFEIYRDKNSTNIHVVYSNFLLVSLVGPDRSHLLVLKSFASYKAEKEFFVNFAILELMDQFFFTRN